MTDGYKTQVDRRHLQVELFDPFEVRLSYRPDHFAHRIATYDTIPIHEAGTTGRRTL